jgi:hypothetical protein
VRDTYRIRETEGSRPPLSVARAAIPSSCRHGHGTVHAPFSVRFLPSRTGTEMYQEKRVWVRGSLEVKTEHSTQLPPRRPVQSVSTQVPGKCHLPATHGLPSIKHGTKELRRVPGKASAICLQPATLPWDGQTVPSSATPLAMGCTPRAAHPGLHTQGCTPIPARPLLNSQASKALTTAQPARPLLNHPDQQGLFQTPRPARPLLNSHTSKASPKTPRPARPLQLLSQQGLYNSRPARPPLNHPDQRGL